MLSASASCSPRRPPDGRPPGRRGDAAGRQPSELDVHGSGVVPVEPIRCGFTFLVQGADRSVAVRLGRFRSLRLALVMGGVS
jgi:hypothetical protein